MIANNLEYVRFTAADYNGYAIFIYNKNLIEDTSKIFVFRCYKTLCYNFTYNAFYC